MRKRPQGKSRLVLVLGGAASGKSERALQLAGLARPRAFVATGQPLDREMMERIERHQTERSTDWTTAEVPVQLAAWFNKKGTKYRTVVIDCLTFWLNNVGRRCQTKEAVNAMVDELVLAIRQIPATVVIVSNEIGMGLVPVGRVVRKFRDLAGSMNQRVAAAADEVYLVVSGQAMRLK